MLDKQTWEALGKHLNFLKIKYPKVMKENKTLFLVTYAGKTLSVEKIKDNLKESIELVSPNSVHPGETDASSCNVQPPC